MYAHVFIYTHIYHHYNILFSVLACNTWICQNIFYSLHHRKNIKRVYVNNCLFYVITQTVFTLNRKTTQYFLYSTTYTFL